MCSITNTAHAIKRSLFRRRPLLLDRARSLSPVCCHVYLLSCLYVVGRHSLVITDLMQKGACNQGGKAQEFLLWSRHS
jgi:hypothetical protein